MAQPKKYHGIVVPMVTPWTDELALDEPAVRRIIDHLVAGGVDAIFVVGTTGESASMSWPSRHRLVDIAVEHTAGRAQVYAGISHNCLSEALQAAHRYTRRGVDALVAHLPYYFTLGPDEQLEYFTRLAEQVSGPLLIYSIPSTTHMSVPVEVVEKLSALPHVVGLKDSEMDLQRLERLIKLLGAKADFSIFTGASSHSAKAFALGADGSVPSAGNLVPEVCAEVYRRARQKDTAGAEQAQQRLTSVTAMFQANKPLAQSVAILKGALHLKGLCGPAMLPPLRTLNPEQLAHLHREMTALGLLT